MSLIAILTTVALLTGAVAAAFVLGWRRYAVQPKMQQQLIRGPSCYPRVERGGNAL